jgi:hypothetical protein
MRPCVPLPQATQGADHRSVKSWSLIVLVGLLAHAMAPQSNAAHPATRWQPAPDLTWQVQFSGPIDLSVRADVYDLDAFETSPRLVRRLHDRGRFAICYINAGAWEDWRPDAARFPASVKGKRLDGWPGERWLDIRRIDVLGPILRDRIAMCAGKGFDGVEFDNVNGYSNPTGFPLRRADQLMFNRWLADAAHAAGLAVGLKNTLDLAGELEPDFDFAILEQCYQYRECALAQPFLEAAKPVVDIEYSAKRADFCPRTDRLGIYAMRKRLALDAWRRAC